MIFLLEIEGEIRNNAKPVGKPRFSSNLGNTPVIEAAILTYFEPPGLAVGG